MMLLYPGRCPGLRASALSGRAASGAFTLLPFTFPFSPVTVGSGVLLLENLGLQPYLNHVSSVILSIRLQILYPKTLNWFRTARKVRDRTNELNQEKINTEETALQGSPVSKLILYDRLGTYQPRNRQVRNPARGRNI